MGAGASRFSTIYSQQEDVQPGTNSTTTLNVKNSSGTSILSVDTSGSNVNTVNIVATGTISGPTGSFNGVSVSGTTTSSVVTGSTGSFQYLTSPTGTFTNVSVAGTSSASIVTGITGSFTTLSVGGQSFLAGNLGTASIFVGSSNSINQRLPGGTLRIGSYQQATSTGAQVEIGFTGNTNQIFTIYEATAQTGTVSGPTGPYAFLGAAQNWYIPLMGGAGSTVWSLGGNYNFYGDAVTLAYNYTSSGGYNAASIWNSGLSTSRVTVGNGVVSIFASPSANTAPSNGLSFTYGSGLVPTTNNQFNLGSGSFVYGNIYLQNNPVVVSDENLKTNISDLPDNLGLTLINGLQTKAFSWVSEPDSNPYKGDIHLGFISQQVNSVIQSLGWNINSTPAQNLYLIQEPVTTTVTDNQGNVTTTTSPMGMATTELISPMVLSIQQLSKQLNAANDTITTLTNTILSMQNAITLMQSQISALQAKVV